MENLTVCYPDWHSILKLTVRLWFSKQIRIRRTQSFTHESSLGRTMSLVDNTIKALKKETEFEVVLKDMEAIKAVLDGL